MATVRRIREKWYLDYVDARGRRHRVRAGTGRTKKVAEQLLRKKLDELDRGISGAGRQLLAEYAKRWIELKRLSVRPGTLHDYRVKLKLYVLHEKHGLGEVPLARLSKPAIEDWLLALRKRRPKLSASTLNAILRVLGGIIESAVDDGIIDVNPVRRVKKLPVPQPKVDFLTPAEVRTLLAGAETVDEDLALLIRMAVFTGIRRGELLALRWMDLDLEARRLYVRRSFRAGIFGEPKSRRSRRPVDLPQGLCGRLAERRAAAVDPRPESLVFLRAGGEQWEPSVLSCRFWHRALKAAGLRETLRWHDLRHTCASLLLDQGESLALVQAQLGHSTGALTMDVYAHVLPATAGAAADRLEQVVEGEPRPRGRSEGSG